MVQVGVPESEQDSGCGDLYWYGDGVGVEVIPSWGKLVQVLLPNMENVPKRETKSGVDPTGGKVGEGS